MHNCAFCKHPLKQVTEWTGKDGRFYSSEFCADAGDMEMPILANRPDVAGPGTP